MQIYVDLILLLTKYRHVFTLLCLNALLAWRWIYTASAISNQRYRFCWSLVPAERLAVSALFSSCVPPRHEPV